MLAIAAGAMGMATKAVPPQTIGSLEAKAPEFRELVPPGSTIKVIADGFTWTDPVPVVDHINSVEPHEDKPWLKADISSATVVTLFLLPGMNIDLIPKFRSQLRPGSRIVAHHFAMGDVWTWTECNEEFYKDMELFEKEVKRLVDVPLDQEQFDSLVSFTYNLGAGNLQKGTLLKKLNAGDYDGAADEFGKWNKAGGKVLAGLTRRRASEENVFRDKKDVRYQPPAEDEPETA